jgi:hypothetical protein
MSKKFFVLVAFALIVVVVLVSSFAVAEEVAAEEKKEEAPAAGGNGGEAAEIPDKKPNPLNAQRRRPGAKRSIFQACRKDIESLCMKADDSKGADKGDRRRALRNAASCLETKKDEVKDESCRAWLNARDKCFADAETACPALVKGDDDKAKAKGATDRGRRMMCLRQAPADKFSTECTQSDFFKAIIGMRRFHKAGANKKDGNKEKASKKDE